MSAQDTITQAVRHLLARDHKTQRQLAAALGCHPSAVTERMKGATRWTAPDLDALAALFDEPFVVFLTERRERVRPAGAVTGQYVEA